MPFVNRIPTLPHEEFFNPTPYSLEFLRASVKREVAQVYSQPDQQSLQRIFELTSQLHAGQWREELSDHGQPMPYEFHSLGVARRGVVRGEPADHVGGYALHDTIEDVQSIQDMLQSDRAILFGNAKTERLVQMLSNYPQASMPGRPKEKLASDQFAQKILQDAAAARGKGDDRFDNLASFARLLQKALNNPSWYSLGPTSWPESRYAPKDGRTFIERLPGRVDKNITSTTEWLLPLIQLAEDRAHPGRRHFHLQIHNELLEMAAKTRERLSAYLFHVN